MWALRCHSAVWTSPCYSPRGARAPDGQSTLATNPASAGESVPAEPSPARRAGGRQHTLFAHLPPMRSRAGSPSAQSPLPPWKFTIEPVLLPPSAGGVAYECRVWSPGSRDPPALRPTSPARPVSPVYTHKQRDRQASLVYGCAHSPVSVPYGNSENPTHYPRPKSAPPKARIDTSLPESCLSPLPPRVDTPIGSCSFPRRVPYGLVATHKQIVTTTHSRPSSALSSPGTRPVSAGALRQDAPVVAPSVHKLDEQFPRRNAQGSRPSKHDSVRRRRASTADKGASGFAPTFVPKPEHRPRWDDVSPHLDRNPLK